MSINRKFFWSTEAQHYLLELARDYPMLWDHRHELFSKNLSKKAKWREVAKLLRDCFPELAEADLNADDCQIKFAKLKSSFQREVRKIHCTQSGSASGSGGSSKWEFFDSCFYMLVLYEDQPTRTFSPLAQSQKKQPSKHENTENTGPARKRRAPIPESSSSAVTKQPKIVSLYMQRHDEDSTERRASHDGSGERAPTSHQSPSNLPTSSAESAGEMFEVRHTAKHFGTILNSLAKDELFVDVTLTAEGHHVKAHKSVLSAVSPYFLEVLGSNPCQHPVIIMPYNVSIEDLKCIISFIYKGELTVSADRLESILRMGEVLKIEGLCSLDSLGREKAADLSSQSFHSDTSQMKPKNTHETSRTDMSCTSDVVGTFIDVDNLKEPSVPAIRVNQSVVSTGDDITTSSLQNSPSRVSENEPRQIKREVVSPVEECPREPSETGDESGAPAYTSRTDDVDNSSYDTAEQTNHSQYQNLQGSSSQISRGNYPKTEEYDYEYPACLENVDVELAS